MTEYTYMISQDFNDTVVNGDPEVSATLPYQMYGAGFVIYNTINSNQIVRIKEISLNDMGGFNATPTVNTTYLERVTSLAPGEEIQPLKLNSAGNNLPSGIKVYRNPGNYSGNETLRNVVSDTFLVAGVGDFTSSPMVGRSVKSSGLSAGVFYTSSDSVAQNITLRENEGIILTNRTNVRRVAIANVRVVFTVNSNTFSVDFVTTIKPSGCIFGLWNEFSSGHVVTVSKVECSLIKRSSLRKFNIENVIDVSDGIDIPVIKLDSTSPNIPSTVLIRKNASVMCAGPLTSETNRLQHLSGGTSQIRKTFHIHRGMYPELASGLMNFGQHDTLFSNRKTVSGTNITLREGDGIAIIERDALYGGIGTQELVVTFSIEDNTPIISSGETSHVF